MLYKLGELGQTDKDTNQMISLNCGIAETNKKKQINKTDTDSDTGNTLRVFGWERNWGAG